MPPQTSSGIPIKAGDSIYLRHMTGDYFTAVYPKRDSDPRRYHWPQLGYADKAKLQIQALSGSKLTDGATVQLQSSESDIGKHAVLGAWPDSRSCYYWKDGYNAKKQGWTITKKDKTSDDQLCYGDAVYLTNLHYENQRLSRDTRYRGYITTVPHANEWWVIESDDYQLSGNLRTEAALLQQLFDPQAQAFSVANMAYLAYCAQMAYLDADRSVEPLAQLGFSLSGTDHFFESRDTDAQGFIVGDDEKIILVFRGTEKLDDWATNIKLDKDAWTPAKPLGRIHRGFYKSLQSIWPTVLDRLKTLQTNNQPIWITGHSLGGALAAIACATLRLQEDPPYNVVGGYTFGQPRVGNADLVKAFDDDFNDHFFRVVNNNDSVARIPKFRYDHMGTLVYFNTNGDLIQGATGIALDRVRGLWQSAIRLDVDNVGDHRMGDYYMLSMRHLTGDVS